MARIKQKLVCPAILKMRRLTKTWIMLMFIATALTLVETPTLDIITYLLFLTLGLATWMIDIMKEENEDTTNTKNKQYH